MIQSVLDASEEVLLLPRPRRFGKTLNLSMLRAFFEREKPEWRDLFQGLAIERAGERYTIHQGRYPVVFLTLKDIKTSHWSDCQSKLRKLIAAEYLRYHQELSNGILMEQEHSWFKEIYDETADWPAYEDSLKNLLTWLQRAFGERVILLIDEYDTPIHAGYQHGYYDEVLGFMRNWLSGALKDHDDLKKGVLTGILRVAKESTFSGLNNLKVHGILDADPFSDKFGFTNSEVEKLLANAGLSDTLPTVRDWYSGYQFGKTTIYNPWSVVNFINDQPAPASTHWINTSDNKLIFNLIRDGGPGVHQGVEKLLEGSFFSEIEDVIPLHDIRESSIWSLLLFSGYLRAVGRHRKGSLDLHRLQLPNRETRLFFVKTINTILEEHLSASALQALLEALVAGEVSTFEKHLKTLVLNLLSVHDTAGGKRRTPEAVYQSFVLGLVANLDHEYRIRSNIESGLGRADILMTPKVRNKRGIVMEFKRLRKGEKMERQLEVALKQIKEKDYGAEMPAEGVKEILKLAIVFDGKKLQVRS